MAETRVICTSSASSKYVIPEFSDEKVQFDTMTLCIPTFTGQSDYYGSLCTKIESEWTTDSVLEAYFLLPKTAESFEKSLKDRIWDTSGGTASLESKELQSNSAQLISVQDGTGWIENQRINYNYVDFTLTNCD